MSVTRSAPIRAALAAIRAAGRLLATLLLLLAWALVLLPAGLVARVGGLLRSRHRSAGGSYWRPVEPPRGRASYLDPF